MATITKDLGIATAYGYALSKGYTGTEEQFAQLMASYATVGQQAAQSAANAQSSAENAEAYADGTRNGSAVPSTDPAYENNSKYYSQQAEASAELAAQHNMGVSVNGDKIIFSSLA